MFPHDHLSDFHTTLSNLQSAANDLRTLWTAARLGKRAALWLWKRSKNLWMSFRLIFAYSGRMVTRRETAEALRETGKMCQFCPRLLDVRAWQGGPQTCERCARPQPITLHYKYESGVWWLHFLEPSSSLPVAPAIRFQDASKIRELVARTPTRWTLGERQAFEYGLVNGDGRCAVAMTSQQLRALRERVPATAAQ
jgi:hypothetical protein